jgi:hypothetical protein
LVLGDAAWLATSGSVTQTMPAAEQYLNYMEHVTDPPDAATALRTYARLNPAILDQPLRISTLVLAPWHWQVLEYPKGHGFRILMYEGLRIAIDMRFAVRPWEIQGKPFITG